MMGSCSIIRELDANHLSNTADSELTRAITRITSGKRVVAVAANAGAARPGLNVTADEIEYCIHFSLIPVSFLTICSKNQEFSSSSRS
jgi:hypothetical protein